MSFVNPCDEVFEAIDMIIKRYTANKAINKVIKRYAANKQASLAALRQITLLVEAVNAKVLAETALSDAEQDEEKAEEAYKRAVDQRTTAESRLSKAYSGLAEALGKK